MWCRLGVVILAAALLSTGNDCSFGKTIYVDDDGPADFDTIQAAINDANNGDIITVAQGSYPEEINFLGKNITLRSTDPTNSNVVKNTMIWGPAIFRGTEDANCTLTGFDVGGVMGYDWRIDRDGENHTHANISHCRLEHITTGCGDLIKGCDGKISNCIIADIMFLCMVMPPVPQIVGCHGLIENCTITNTSGSIEVRPGGTTTLRNCILHDSSWPLWFDVPGGATLNISYCSLWGEPQISGGGTVNWGPGNFEADPCFANDGPSAGMDDDYHLKSQAGRWDASEARWVIDDVTSPCIDKGNPMMPVWLEPFPNGGIVNIGAYGGTPEASKSYFGGPPCEVIVAGDINGDCNVNFLDFRLMALHWLEDNAPDCAATTTYQFVPDPNALLTSGGFDGNGFGSFCVVGQFDLTVDSCAGTAWFENADFDAGDMCEEPEHTFSLDGLYHMSELVSTDVNETQIDFLFEANNPTFPGADVHLRATFLDGSVRLVANVCDPMYDGYCYHLNAVAVREE
jgi:hypothetical protein